MYAKILKQISFERKMKMKTTVKFLSLVLAVVMIAASFASCSSKKKSTASDYLEKIFDVGNTETIEYDVIREDISFNPSVFLGPESGFENVSFSVYTGKSGTVLDLGAVAGGQNTNVMLFYSGESVAIKSNVLGDKALGMSLSELQVLLEQLGGAAPYADNAFEGGASIGLGGLLSGSGAMGDLLAENGEKIEKFVAKYVQVLADSIDNAAEQSVKVSSDITVNVKFNGDSAKKAIKDVYNTLKRDRELRKFVEDIAKTVAPDEYQAIIAGYDSIFESDDVLEQLFAMISEYDAEIGMTVVADKQYNLKALKLYADVEGYEVSFSFDGTDENNIKLALKMDMGEENFEVQMNIKTVTTGDVTKTALIVSGLGAESFEVLSVETDAEGNYTLRVDGDILGMFVLNSVETIGVIEIKGKVVEAEGMVSVDTVVVGDMEIKLGLTMKTTLNGEMPAFPSDYDLITDLTEADLVELQEKIMSDPVISYLAELFSSMEA